MRRSVRLWYSRGIGFACLGLIAAAGATLPAQQQIVPGTNVNMVSGTKFPEGDPYLQRQNEPSSAVSTRNPLHILGGANDYRTVDIPHPLDTLRTHLMNSDAWLGLFKSLDGGQNWSSTLLPGYPQDPTRAAPLWGYDAATDPFVRAGTSGMFYFAGLAFNRGENAPSAIFVARFMDMNNLEAGDPIVHLNTRIVDSDTGTRFLDKTALATDVPRTAATCTFSVPLGDADNTVVPQTIPAGNVYVAYSAFTGAGAAEQSVILFSRSTNCGSTWSAPKALSTGSRLVQNAQIAVDPATGYVYVSWRRFRYLSQDDAVMVVRSTDGGVTFGKPVRVAGVQPFDQPTRDTSFRSNGFQTMTVDATGRAYLAWTERGHAPLRPSPVDGDARIVITTSTNGTLWTVPRPIAPDGLGHQLMPALTFHAGRLRLLYYDLREDVSQVFAPFVDELNILQANSPVRHTMDVFVAQANPGVAPVFTTARLSDYAFGFLPDSDTPLRLQFNPPNLPLFKQGTAPFMGDYIDLAPSPAYIQNANGTWSYNAAPSTAATSHAFWTDNRDVRPPRDGDWTNYAPPRSAELGVKSRFDPTIDVPACTPDHDGMRNQNIYTARVTEGLFVAAPGNNKPLGSLQRAFVVIAENATGTVRSFRFTIDNQPVGGQASFLQFAPLPTLDVTVPAYSSVARSVFASSSDERARVNVSLVEITAPGGIVVPGGLAGSVTLNADPSPLSPRLQNPRLQNPRLQNPLIADGEAYNAGITNAVFAVPRLQNPRLQNPSIENPRLQNDPLGNPRLQNDTVANAAVVSVGATSADLESPRLQNPRLQNPRLQNQALDDASFMDTSWAITNNGNTTAAYTINLVLNEPIPAGFASQLLIHKTTTTPASTECNLAEQVHTVLVANIPDPEFVPFTDVANPRLQNPRLQNPTLALAPGESATVTLRIVDPDRFDAVTYDASGAVTPAAVAQSVNTTDVAAGITTPTVAVPLTITTTDLTAAQPGAPYSRSLQTLAAVGALTCSVTSGTLPPGVTLDPGGTISGTPTTPGNYRFTVSCVDANGNVDDQPLFLQVDPVVPAGFDAAWNGADTDWSNPNNWSPRGVPQPAARVFIPASSAVVPTLTRPVTIRDLVVEPGATVDTGGFALTITHNVDAGRTIVGGGTTILTGDGGVALGVFSNLQIAGRVTLNGPLTVTGQLTLGAGARLNLNRQSLIVGGRLATNITSGALPVVTGPAASFIVGGVLVNGLVLEDAPLVVDGSAAGVLSQFDNVRFGTFAPEAIQLTVNHPGLPQRVAMNGIAFSTTPTSGRLIQANDTVADGNTLTVDILNGVPADGAVATSTIGGAVVNWLSNPGDANLSVTQTVTPIPAAAGSPLTYLITVTNGGPAIATGVVLNPGVPAGATGVTASGTQGTCAVATGVWSCLLGSIPAGAHVVVTVSFVPLGAGTLVTTATVTATTPDPSQGNNTHAIAATVVAAGTGVSLTLAKTGSTASVGINTAFTYTLTITNAGTTTATGVIVTDPVPAGLTISSATVSQGTCSTAAGQVLCSIGTLPPGQAATITLIATATVAGLLTNAAGVTSDGLELTPADNVAVVQTMVLATTACSVPTFSGPTSYPGSPGPGAVVRLVDMDHDGDLDAVMTHETSGGGVDVFLNDGTGHFAPPRFTSTVTSPWIHVVADFNGDTYPDVVSSSDAAAFGVPVTLRLLTNDGTGGLTLVPSFSIPFGGYMEAVDLDRDGDQDLLIAAAGGGVALLRNDGAANFAPPVPVAAGHGFVGAFDDYNGDNRTDMIVALGTAGFGVVLADTAGGFLPPVVHAVAGGVHAFSAADLNGDGHLDLLIIEGDDEEPTGRTSVILGDGAGGFGAPTEVATGSFIYFPTLTDINGDGRPDLAAISGLGTFEVRLGDGAGGFSAAAQFSNAIYYGPAVGDLNHDGRPDIVIGDRSGQLNVFFNNCGAAPANLGVTVSESADLVNEGDEITYTVNLTNHAAADAIGVRLRSVLSQLDYDDGEEPNVTMLEATSSAGGGTLATAGNVFTWTFPTVAANSAATFVFRFRTLSGGALLFTSGVTSDGAEVDPSDNAAFATTTVAAIGRTIEVTTTNDGGPGSLRQAIIESNGDAGDVDLIVFHIGAGGARTITVLSALPDITEPAIIDGTTQPGFSGTPIIELNGNGLAATNGLFISGGNTTVRGLVINRFGQNGIALLGGGGNVVEGNYLGLDEAGTAPRPNVVNGVLVFSSNNRIGGPTSAQRNVISGNQQAGVFIGNATATRNLVQGNYIGTDASGTAAVPNQGVQSGISITNGASTNTVSANVVSGNRQHAVTIFGPTTSANVVQGNFIGTDPTGMTRLANGGIGLDIVSATNTVVGGPGLARNIISGNGTGIQLRTGATGNRFENNYIGINAAGAAAIANSVGISINDAADSNTIGGTTAGAGNVISGNTGTGVSVTLNARFNLVQGNRIGTNGAGTAAVPNATGVSVDAASTTIGGTTPLAGNVISGNLNNGVLLQANASATVVQGNRIGTNALGTAALGNGTWGVQLANASNNVVGGSAPGAGNLISGNVAGGIVLSGTSTGNTVSGNRIGTAADGLTPLPNQSYGVGISSASGNTIGDPAAPNTIAFNTGAGVQVLSGSGNVITSNSVLSNGGLGINLGTDGVTPNDQDDADAGANGQQNYPVLTRAVLSAAQFDLDVTLNSIAGRAYTIEYFRSASCDPSGFGEGAQPAGVTSLGVTGNPTTQFTASMGAAGFAVGQFITATATSSDGTSEFSACIQVTAPVTPQTFVVTNTNDSGPGSLRQAILDANAVTATRDTIAFDIPGSGAHTISPLSILPTLTGPVVIDATTQPGFAGSPLVEIDGTSAGGTANGLWLTSSGSVIRGLVLNRFGTGGAGGGGGGIVLQGGGNHVVEGNFVGTDLTGTIARPNRVDGIWIDSPANRIGGTTVAARNVISGNGRNGIELAGAAAAGNTVQGNYIGVDRDGVGDLGNTGLGIDVFSAPSNTIGGTTAAARNVISGNNSNGITISGATATSNVVQGNYVGTDATGTVRVGNSLEGIVLFASNNTIGGTTPGAGNVIAANRFGLWVNSGDNNVIQGNFVGTNAASATGLGNASIGMLVFGTGNIVGGTSPGAGNVIVANGGEGLRIAGPASIGAVVQGNFIGTNAAGAAGLGNAGPGVSIFNGATNHTIGGSSAGAGNVIARNAGAGITVTDTAAGNAFRANSIHSNGGLGIDLQGGGITPNDAGDVDSGPNHLQNFPVLTAVATDGVTTSIDGRLDSTPSTTFTVELFSNSTCDASGNGEGQTFLGSLTATTDSNGTALFNQMLQIAGAELQFTATATHDGTKDTSEFSACFQAQASFSPTVTITAPDPAASEAGTDPGTFTFTRTGSTTQSLDVAFSVSGTAINGIDYSPTLTGSLTIPAGQASASIVVTPVNDTLREGPETAIVTVAASAGYVVGSPGTATVTIADDDAATIEATDATAAELGPDTTATLVVSRGTGESISADRDVQVAIAGTAANFSDYTLSGTGLTDQGSTFFAVRVPAGQPSVTVTLTTIFSPAVEGAETALFTVEGGPIVTVNIADEAAATIVATDAAAAELGPDTTATLVVSRGGASNYDRDVQVAIAGTAANFSDYTLSGTGLTDQGSTFFAVRIPAGQPSVTVTLTTISDGLLEAAESAIFTAEGSSATITIADAAANRRPVANAGADQSVTAGATVQLNGSGSNDADNDPLTYAWTFGSRPAGSAATFSDAGAAAPTFLADASGIFVIQLIVNDGTENSEPDIVEIHTNGPPVANAGPDRIVPRSSVVQMDGSASSDPDGAPLAYHWILNNKPPGSAAALSNADIVNPSFTADRPGAYLLQLVVNDGLVNSASDLVQILTDNVAPLANAGPDQAGVALSALVTLDGSQSSDPDGDDLTYSWDFLQTPEGSSAALANPATPSPSFTVDRPGRYRVRLTVTDPLTSIADDVDVTTVNLPPIASAGPDQRVAQDSLVTLDGGGSSDPDANPLTYSWSFVAVPAGSTAQLTNANTIAPTFTPDRPGIYTLRLVVNDTIEDSQPDTVAITVFSNVIAMALVGTELVGVGRPATLRVILPVEAPTGGVSVTVTSDDSSVLTVTSPGTVLIAEGQTTGDGSVNGIASGVTFVRAAAAGYPDGEFQVTVTPNVLTAPAAVNVPFGQTSSLPITIPHPAPAGGLVVTLLSGDASLVQVMTPTVTIPAGAVGANGTLRGVSTGSASVVASAPAYSGATTVASTTGNVSILGAPFTLNPQLPRTVTVRLESAGIPVAAPAPGVVVTLAAADSTCLAVPSTATIATGLVSTSFVLAYGGGATLPCTTSLTATVAGLPPQAVSVTVNPVSDITFFGPGGIRVGGGLATSLSVDSWALTWQLADANHGGGTMRIRSLDPTRLTVVTDVAGPGQEFIDVTVSAGQTYVPFGLKAVEGRTGVVDLTATMTGFNAGTVQAEVVQPALSIVSLPGTTTAQSPESVFQVAVGIPDASGTFLRQVQPVQRDLIVAVSNLTATVAQLRTATQTAQTGMVTIPANAGYSPQAVATGGIAFDPLAQGQTTVTAAATNYTSVLGTSADVTVTGADITFFGPGGVRVGGGLITNLSADGWTLSFALGATGHGGGTMRIRSSNAGRLTVAADLTSAGQEFVDIPVAAGSASVPFVVRGIEGQTGLVDLTATMAGFTDAATQAEVVTPALAIVSIPGTITTQSDEAPFQVAVGIRDATNTYLRQTQPVLRDLTVSVANLTASVAQLHTSTQSAQTATVTIAANSAYSPGTVATGGIAFDPLVAGQTTVTAAATNFPTALGASADVTVTGADITFFGPGGIRVGSGLVTGLSADYWSLGWSLGASGHGGGSMRITSSDASKLSLSADSSSPGQAFIDVPVPAGAVFVPFVVRGVAGQTGSVELTAAMPGFNGGSTSADVVQPVLGILGLPATTTALSDDTPFSVGAGIPDPTGTYVRQYQPVQSDLLVTVSNLTSTVAQLQTSTGTGQSRTVTILAGAQYSPGDLASGGIEFDPIGGGQTTVSAAAAGFAPGFAASSVNVTVTGADIALYGFPARVGGGLRTNLNQDGGGTFALAAVLNATGHGGTAVHLESSNPSVLLLSADGLAAGSRSIDLPVAAGQSTAVFFVEGVARASGTVTVTGSAPGFGDVSGTVDVVPPRLMISNLAPTTTALSPEAVFNVGVGLQHPFGGYLVSQSAVADTLVSITSSNPAVAQLRTQAGVGQNRTITIAANEYVSRFDVATGGIAFDPLGPGATAVTASSPGFDNSGFGTVNVTVTTPRITMQGLPFQVGAGLQANVSPFCCAIAALLEGSDHGGVTVRIRSLTPAVALVALDDVSPGAEFVDVLVPAGGNVAPYYVQGVAVGTASLSATATGFLDGIGSVDVVQPALQIANLPSSMAATDASQAFYVVVGLPAADGSVVSYGQAARAGSPLTATVTNSNAGVAQLVTLAGGAQSRTVTIPAGSAYSSTTLAGGGIEFDALAAGSTTVTATIPGFVPTTAATVSVVINP